MPINSRTKGQNGEREFAALILDQLGVKLVRNLSQTRAGGYDLSVPPEDDSDCAALLNRYAIEIKRSQRERITDKLITSWWAQATRQAEPESKIPVLAWKPDRQEWKVMIPLQHVYGDDVDQGYTASMSLEAFCYLIREGL